MFETCINNNSTCITLWLLLLIAYKSSIRFDVFILGQHDYFIHDITFYASKDCKSSNTAFIHIEVHTTDISSSSFHYYYSNGTILTTKSLSFCKDLPAGREYLLSYLICHIISISDFIEKCPNSTQISLPFPVWNYTGVVSYQYGIIWAFNSLYSIKWSDYELDNTHHVFIGGVFAFHLVFVFIIDCSESVTMYWLLIPFSVFVVLSILIYMCYNLYGSIHEMWITHHINRIMVKRVSPKSFSAPIPLNHNPYSHHLQTVE